MAPTVEDKSPRSLVGLLQFPLLVVHTFALQILALKRNQVVAGRQIPETVMGPPRMVVGCNQLVALLSLPDADDRQALDEPPVANPRQMLVDAPPVDGGKPVIVQPNSGQALVGPPCPPPVGRQMAKLPAVVAGRQTLEPPFPNNSRTFSDFWQFSPNFRQASATAQSNLCYHVTGFSRLLGPVQPP
jgi:hypothetical protein